MISIIYTYMRIFIYLFMEDISLRRIMNLIVNSFRMRGRITELNGVRL